MIVKLVKDTIIDGVLHNLGETVDTAEKIGKKLISRGYAEINELVEEQEEEHEAE
jgi:hypothetical protein